MIKDTFYQQLKLIKLLGIFLPFPPVCAEGGNDGFDMEELWSLFRFLIGLGVVISALQLLLYRNFATYLHLKKYRSNGRITSGDVLSCDKCNSTTPTNGAYEIHVLYSARQHKYTDPRMRFRFPDANTTKRLLRRFQTQSTYSRGSKIEIIFLPNEPRSGITFETLEAKEGYNCSHCFRAVFILVPGLILISTFLILSVWEIQVMDNERDKLIGYISLILTSLIFFFGSRNIADKQFQKEKVRIFNSSIVVGPRKLVNPTDPSNIPVVMGVDTKSDCLLTNSYPHYQYTERPVV